MATITEREEEEEEDSWGKGLKRILRKIKMSITQSLSMSKKKLWNNNNHYF